MYCVNMDCNEWGIVHGFFTFTWKCLVSWLSVMIMTLLCLEFGFFEEIMFRIHRRNQNFTYGTPIWKCEWSIICVCCLYMCNGIHSLWVLTTTFVNYFIYFIWKSSGSITFTLWICFVYFFVCLDFEKFNV